MNNYCPPIAVLTDRHGNPCDYFEAEALMIYREDVLWKKERVVNMTREEKRSVAQIRKDVQLLIEQISPCNIIVARDLSGIPYAAFDMSGFQIFTIQTLSDEILSEIVEEVFAADREVNLQVRIRHKLGPVEMEAAGNYYMDLVMLQNENPDITTKMALADFLAHTPFLALTIRCDHVPPWIRKSGEYTIHTRQDNGSTLAVIQKNIC